MATYVLSVSTTVASPALFMLCHCGKTLRHSEANLTILRSAVRVAEADSVLIIEHVQGCLSLECVLALSDGGKFGH